MILRRACDGVRRVEGRSTSLLPSILAALAPLAFAPIAEAAQRDRAPPPPATIVGAAEPLESKSEPREAADRVPRDLLPPPPPSLSTAVSEEQDRSDYLEVLGAHREVLDGFWMSSDLELALLRDLLFVFQGVAGRHIKYDPRSESFVLDPALPLRSHARDLVLCLCELGWLFAKVDAYVQRAETDRFRGLLVHALGFALQEELHDYYRLLAVLEQELGRRTKALRDGKGRSAGLVGLTLLRLRVWVQEPLERMQLMARLVESVGPLSGGALASRLFGHSKHGDAAVRGFVTRVTASACSPLTAMLTRWLVHGELQDPHREFFVSVNEEALQTDAAWHKLFSLNLAMLPSFISLDLATRILVVGKSISFIRICEQRLSDLPEDEKLLALPQKTEEISNAPTTTAGSNSLVVVGDAARVAGDMPSVVGSLLSHDDELVDCLQGLMDQGGGQRLASLIDRISSSIDSRLMNLMDSRFFLSTHLLSLKKFMLLGQGDFVTCLMDALGPELRKKATALYRHNLTGMLEGALRSSNAQFEPAFVLERVGVRLLEASPGDSGWEVFTLDYAVDSPLSAVVHGDAMGKYRAAFHTLWKLKRLEWSLSSSWRQLMAFNHMRGGLVVPRLKSVLHHCSLSRAFMMHVINNFCAFMQFEVIETAWNAMQAALAAATCLDDVVAAHDSYLAEIQRRALLDVAHEAFNVQVQLMLQSMLRFCSLEESLIADALATISRRRALINDLKARGGSGNRDHEAEYELEEPLTRAESMTGDKSQVKNDISFIRFARYAGSEARRGGARLLGQLRQGDGDAPGAGTHLNTNFTLHGEMMTVRRATRPRRYPGSSPSDLTTTTSTLDSRTPGSMPSAPGLAEPPAAPLCDRQSCRGRLRALNSSI